MRTSVTVCVATYRRPAGLRRLLASLDELVFDDPAPDVRVVIVDNDPDGPAVDVRSQRWPTTVLHEPRPGIPFARNRAVKKALEAESDWLAFVDDDETVAPQWMAELLRTAAGTRASIVTGPVLGVLPNDAPGWARKGVFDRPRRRQGDEVKLAGTGNLLIQSDLLRAVAPAWFREDLVGVGGSDSELTGRLARQGSHIVWAADAITYEHWPRDRVTLRWLVRRGFRGGTTRGLLLRLWADVTAGEFAQRALAALAIAGRGVVVTVAGVLGGRHLLARGLRDLAVGVGTIAGLLGRPYHEYRR